MIGRTNRELRDALGRARIRELETFEENSRLRVELAIARGATPYEARVAELKRTLDLITDPKEKS